MDLVRFTSRFWHWLTDCSPRNAATPTVQARSGDYAPGLGIPPASETIEVNVETECINGSPTEVGLVETLQRGPEGELVRSNRRVALVLGCGHLVSQFQAVDEKGRHVLGIAGQCYYCASKYQQQLLKGEISAFDADRLSRVCSDCGKMTTSGLLCCPKHYAAVVNPDGTTTYIGPEETKQRGRQDKIRAILGPIVSLLSQGDPGTAPESPQEHNYDQKTD